LALSRSICCSSLCLILSLLIFFLQSLRAGTQNEGYPGPSSLFLLLDLDRVRGGARERVLEPNAELVLLQDPQPLQSGEVLENQEAFLPTRGCKLTSVAKLQRKNACAREGVWARSGSIQTFTPP
jgi:hypothetical protein